MVRAGCTTQKFLHGMPNAKSLQMRRNQEHPHGVNWLFRSFRKMHERLSSHCHPPAWAPSLHLHISANIAWKFARITALNYLRITSGIHCATSESTCTSAPSRITQRRRRSGLQSWYGRAIVLATQEKASDSGGALRVQEDSDFLCVFWHACYICDAQCMCFHAYFRTKTRACTHTIPYINVFTCMRALMHIFIGVQRPLSRHFPLKCCSFKKFWPCYNVQYTSCFSCTTSCARDLSPFLCFSSFRVIIPLFSVSWSFPFSLFLFFGSPILPFFFAGGV